MKVLTVKYNEIHDEVKIKFTKEINECDWLTKADVLSDLIHMLTNEYNTLLSISAFCFSDKWQLGNLDKLTENLNKLKGEYNV
jgi:hypothetical protein